MSEYLSFIFGEVDFTVFSPVAVVCIYSFALLLECISSVVQSTLNIGGIK